MRTKKEDLIKAITQLENLRYHCKDMADSSDDFRNVWEEDVNALDMVIYEMNDKIDKEERAYKIYRVIWGVISLIYVLSQPFQILYLSDDIGIPTIYTLNLALVMIGIFTYKIVKEELFDTLFYKYLDEEYEDDDLFYDEQTSEEDEMTEEDD